MTLRIAVSAGEVSGDQHLAEVIRALRVVAPGCEIRGMGGAKAQGSGAELVVDAFRHGAAMGFLELLGSLRSIRYSLATMKAFLKAWKPQVLIIVDYPDFNLRLADCAKALGIKVLYYIPPKVWAWRSGRVPKIRRVTDCIAAIFPFEPAFYHAHGVTHVHYVGNPVADAAREVAQHHRELSAQETHIAEAKNSRDVVILAGSRRSEITRILIPLLKTFEILHRKHPSLTATVVAAANMTSEKLQAAVSGQIGADALRQVRWSSENALTVMRRGRIGFLKSGTCNLEAAMMGLPFVCVYSGTRLAKWIVDNFVAIKEYSPVNIIRAGTVSEVIQVDLDPVYLAELGEKILAESEARARMELALSEVRGALQGGADPAVTGRTVAERVAHLAIGLV